MIDNQHPTIALLEEKHRNMMMTSIDEIKARNGDVHIIDICKLPGYSSEHVQEQYYDSSLFAIVMTIPMQCIAYYVALEKGLNVDKPRNLAKCVTVE